MRGSKTERDGGIESERKRPGQMERITRKTETRRVKGCCVLSLVCLYAGLHVSTSCPLATLSQTDEGNSAILTQILGKGPFSALPP